MKNRFIKFILASVLLFLPFSAAQAFSIKASETVHIPEDEIISENLYVTGQIITIDGEIAGDLIAIAQTINVNGRIEGDIIGIAEEITVNGQVNGNIRAIGATINLNGSVARNVNIFSETTILGPHSKIGWDLTAAGNLLESAGHIDGDLTGLFGRLLVSGEVGKNIKVKMSDNVLDGALIISPEATINDNLTYISKTDAQIDEEAKILGEIIKKIPSTQAGVNFFEWLWPTIYSIFGALVVGLIFIFLIKEPTPKIIKKIKENPLRSSLYGLILMVTLPLIAILLIFTLIGIPLSLIIFVVWLVCLYLAKIFTAILIGDLILKNINKKNAPKLIWSLILGVTLCWLLFATPYVGWLFSLISAWLGLGGIFVYASNQSKHL